ncbi:hypothetical protein KHA90_14205 [Flavobacterium psychroterrae]|uniref:Uncharacterized protein n=1 Tax=Flavobacterium psychroterrae TaxID=2133767 RepID=A0ABS5PD18_9FLAO|nr:hypothetical protein [Flavobacterium psychroterrae]MBS7232179.1 hypothetical protein [Flavobacterium psychroterrae]
MSGEKIAFDSGFSINFGASNQKRVYGFCYESFENDILKNQVHYEIEIAFLQDDHGRNSIFEINRNQVYVNNKTSDSKIKKIAERASQAIFPLRVKMKRNGKLEEILTMNAIKKRWIIAKEEILEGYKGETIYKIIHKIDTVFLDDDLLKESICRNWFFHLYFKPFYVEYKEKLRCKFIWDSPIFGNQCIKYGVVHTIQKDYDNDDKIIINADGIGIDERSIEEIMEGYDFPKNDFVDQSAEPVTSQMLVDYKLYKEDRSIFSVTGTFETKINQNKQHKIQVEIYHFADTSSFRPWSDFAAKESQRIFQSYQKFDDDDDDIIDIVAASRIRQPELPKREMILGPPRERIELYIHEEPDLSTKKGFWNKMKSIFKK